MLMSPRDTMKFGLKRKNSSHHKCGVWGHRLIRRVMDIVSFAQLHRENAIVFQSIEKRLDEQVILIQAAYDIDESVGVQRWEDLSGAGQAITKLVYRPSSLPSIIITSNCSSFMLSLSPKLSMNHANASRKST